MSLIIHFSSRNTADSRNFPESDYNGQYTEPSALLRTVLRFSSLHVQDAGFLYKGRRFVQQNSRFRKRIYRFT